MRQSTVTCPLPPVTPPIRRSKILQRKILWSTEAFARICSVKKGVIKVFAICTRKYLRWSLFKTKLQVFSLQLYQKRDSHTDVFQCILQIFKTRFFKYSFKWLLLIGSWISLKVAPIAIALMFLKLVVKESSYFFLTWDLLTANLWKF